MSLSFVKRLAPKSRAGDHRNMGVGSTMSFGIVVIVLFLGGFGAWALFATLESAAIAQGVLIVSGERKTVQHLEGGIVTDILVKGGDQVTAGQTLLVLGDTQSRALLSLLEAQFRSAAALQARLEAERDGQPRIRFPRWLNRAVRTQGLSAAHANGNNVLATQERIFRARAQSLANQEAIYNRQIAQQREDTVGLEEEIQAQDRQLELLGEEVRDARTLRAEGLESKTRLLALERREAQLVGQRARNKARIASIAQNISEMQLSITELGNARLSEVVQELSEVETQTSDLRERIQSARDVFSRTNVAATVSGTVMALRVFTRGGVIRAGEPLMDIVPDDDPLVIEAWVNPNDIDVVVADLPAKVRLTSFSHLTVPLLSGKVLQVSADSIIHERTGTALYEARVELDPEQPELAGLKLQPGMPAEVMIVTGKRTPLDYLIKPLVTSFRRALREE